MIPVESHFLYSIREQASFTWSKMLCELIDNSFDARSERVTLSFPGGKVFRIEDDGVGTDDLTRLITLGRRHDHQTNDVGRFGVGCKLALIWLWGVSRLETLHATGASELTINWGELAEGVAEYPTSSEPSRRATRGTSIECRGDRNYPRFDSLLQTLSSTYTPGIELGRKLTITLPRKPPKLLKPRPWPRTSQSIDDCIEVAGRQIRVRMGIVADGEKNAYANGFSFERTYRVIKESTLGANGFAVGRICARITLGKEWELSTNKDDLNEYQDELADAIYNRCAGLMQQASEQAISIEDAAFNQELAEIIQESERKRRKEGRSSPQNKSGAVEPKNTGRRRENAAIATDDPGSVLGENSNRRKRSGFSVEPYEPSTDDLSFGYYDGDGNRVRLNMGNAWLQEMYRDRNRHALLPVVYGILADYAVHNDRRRTPLFVDQMEGFLSQWGAAVSAASEAEVTV